MRANNLTITYPNPNVKVPNDADLASLNTSEDLLVTNNDLCLLRLPLL